MPKLSGPTRFLLFICALAAFCALGIVATALASQWTDALLR